MDTPVQLEANTEDREIIVRRTLNAPRELVFKVWTDPNHVGNWWGPKGFTNTIHEMDVRPGGVWRFMMHGPDGVDYPNRVEFLEVVEPERLVYTHGDDGETKEPLFVTTVLFKDVQGKTDLTMRALFATAEERDRVVREVGAIEGGQQTIDRLEQYLAEFGQAPGTKDI